jgi:hypothetical protein
MEHKLRKRFKISLADALALIAAKLDNPKKVAEAVREDALPETVSSPGQAAIAARVNWGQEA